MDANQKDSQEDERIVLHCLRCDYYWYQQDPNHRPVCCADCGRRNWDKPPRSRRPPQAAPKPVVKQEPPRQSIAAAS